MFTSIVIRFAALGCGLLLLVLVLVGFAAAPVPGTLGQTQTLYWALAALLTVATVLIVIGANARVAPLGFAHAMRAGMAVVVCLSVALAGWAFLFYGYWHPQALAVDAVWQLEQLASNPLSEPQQSARIKELEQQPVFLQSAKFQALWHFVLLFSLGSFVSVIAAWVLPRGVKPRLAA